MGWRSIATADGNEQQLADHFVAHDPRHDIDESILADIRRPQAPSRAFVNAFDLPFDSAGAALSKCSLREHSGRGPLLFVFVAIAAAMLLWYSSETVLQLKADPPAEYAAAVAAGVDGSQQLWAHHYWECARRIQARYVYGQILPDTPPPDFHAPEESATSQEAAAEIRLAYWKQLQKAWLDPSAWVVTRRMRTEFILKSLRL